MFRTAWILATKDLLSFSRDRTALMLTFLLPIVLGAVFGTAMSSMSGGGSGASTPKVELAVEDRDMSDLSRALVAALQTSAGLSVEPSDGARRRVANGEVACGLVIPEGYGAGLAAGDPLDLLLLCDPSQAISQQVVLFQLAPVLLKQQLDTMGAGVMGRALERIDFPAPQRALAEVALRMSYDRIESLLSTTEGTGDTSEATPDFDLLSDLPGLLGLQREDVAGRAGADVARNAGPSHAFAAMAVMMLLFSVVGAGGSLLQERAQGTLTRLQLTPSAGGAVLIGKLIAIAAIALAQLVTLFAFGALVFGVPVAEAPALLALVSVIWVFLAIGIGILFAVVCRTQKQLEGISTLVILVMSAVGGAWFPREITPEWFRAVGSVTPVAWAMDAYHGVLWYGKGILPTAERSGIWPQLLTMAAVALVLLALAFRQYRRRFGAT